MESNVLPILPSCPSPGQLQGAILRDTGSEDYVHAFSTKSNLGYSFVSFDKISFRFFRKQSRAVHSTGNNSKILAELTEKDDVLATVSKRKFKMLVCGE